MDMKLVSLNIWGAKMGTAFTEFVEEQKSSTDIFCFQEVFNSPRTDIPESGETRIHIFEELKAILPDFSAEFFPIQKGLDLNGDVDFEVEVGHAIFVRTSTPIISSGQVFTRGKRDGGKRGEGWQNIPTALSYVRIPFGKRMLSVLNFHGIPFPADKLDTEARLEQSRRILEFLEGEKGEIILAGDFNLMPDTESVSMFEPLLRNLIKEYDITMTRSEINPYYGTPEQQNFADYTFVSKGIAVSNFTVPADCVASDHLPMILEFS
ncbi:MAG: endonuclease/exonuclease/phosphatase family protein [Candidatus Sungbacteria bacterium]|uniref:Endonuclease/exonuclease/phosphatase family protein n=1 Tax=Candidatus Sungiibacteriota bacterium TaxID=2750080 RepID=A0A932R0S7_9BACT|nr:endonuclease/exonuclease/phosphatase family protein [Candidatus Sungbacteria bacterium]